MKYFKQQFRFGIAGVISFGSNLLVTAFLHEIIRWSEEISYGIALLAVSLLMFFFCRYFVFESDRPKFGSQLIKFYQSWVVFRALEYFVFLMILKWAGLFYLFAITGAQIMFVFFKFIVWRRFVFVPASA